MSLRSMARNYFMSRNLRFVFVTRKLTVEMKPRKRRNPFCRPWMGDEWAASGPAHRNTTLKALLAGAITGGMEVCLAYPTEFAKTQLQLDERTHKQRLYTGFFDVIRKNVAEKGFFALYRGMGVVLFFSIPKISIRFATFEALKEQAVDERGNLSPLMRAICGLGAGMSEAVFAVTPMETIKVKFIHDQQKPVPQYKNLTQGISGIIQAEGLRGIYRGFTATVLKQGSNQAIRFYVVETLKHNYRDGDPDVPVPNPVVGLFGVAAAVASVLGNNPIDVVKTRLQGIGGKKYKNTLDCTQKIWNNEGPMGFCKGLSARLVRVGLEVGLTFMFYDSVMQYLNEYWQ